jgi:F0F1-type ATP synthase assembly protein I
MRKFPFAPQDFATISTLGLEFAVAVALGVTAGYFADQKWNSFPWCMIIGVFAGFSLGMYIVVKEAKRMEKENALKDKK